MILLWAPVVVYMAAIIYGATAASVPGPVGSWFSDTFLHGGGYFGLALLTLRALARGRWSGVTTSALLLAWCISMVHGAAVEWLQMYVPTRMAEWRDLGNNAIGAAVALGAARAWGIMRSTSRAKPNS
ncbi:MAG: VanZ family protein [Acidobacteriota bacterium]|nr:VanZ family protein [Acidobacteriota bacterium]